MTKVQRHPLDLRVGEVITEHPGSGRFGRWTVANPPVRFECMAEIDWTAPGGEHGTFVVEQRRTVVVETSPRQDLIAGLRELADFLAENPDVPVGANELVTVQHTASIPLRGCPWGQAMTEIDAIAADLDRPATGDSKRRQTERWFGPVRYLALVLRTYHSEEPTR